MSIKKEGYRMSMNDLVLKVNDVLTGSVLIIALVGIGLLFTFKLGFIQIRGFKDGWNRTFSGLFSKKGDAGKDGMSSFQALATAIAAQVGTGNIAGAATAIAVGGPGAIFWMWISAFLGMSTIFAEAVQFCKCCNCSSYINCRICIPYVDRGTNYRKRSGKWYFYCPAH